MKIYLFPNLSKSNCREYVIKACEILHKCGAELFISDKYTAEFKDLSYVVFGEENECIMACEIIVAIGGDGTILKCSLKSSRFKKPVLGINCGRLGFMASLEHSQIELLKRLTTGNYTLSRRMMLNVQLQSVHNGNKSFTALNDIVISKSDDCKIADFEVSKNGQLVSSLRADGVIFSTATGATAYSMSAGGPIIEPEMKCIEFTQICAHSLFARTMIFGPESVITAKCHTNNDTHANLIVDGNHISKMTRNDIITVSKSELYVDIIDIIGNSFFSSVNKKLMQPLKDITGGI